MPAARTSETALVAVHAQAVLGGLGHALARGLLDLTRTFVRERRVAQSSAHGTPSIQSSRSSQSTHSTSNRSR